MRTLFKWLTVVVLAIAMASLSTALPTRAQSGDAADFSWSMPSRFGTFVGNTRLLGYPQSPAEVDSGPFAVDFALPDPACMPGVSRRFSVADEDVPAERLGQGCTFRMWSALHEAA